jgi:leader peptidase (prepilin peptidase)/N-methyltransferase
MTSPAATGTAAGAAPPDEVLRLPAARLPPDPAVDAARNRRRQARRRRLWTAAVLFAFLYAGVLAAGVMLGAVRLSLVPLSVLLAIALVSLSAIDWVLLLLPDRLSLPLVAAGIAATVLIEPAAAVWHVAAAGLGFAALAAVASAYRRLRGRMGLGGGDPKLLAAGGAWLGPAALPHVVLVAALTGLAEALVRRAAVFARANSPRRIAFGPHLAFAIWLIWIFDVPAWR